MPGVRRGREDWSIHARWHHGAETPGESIRRLQRFIGAISKIAPIFSQLVLSPGAIPFASCSHRRLVNFLKKSPVKESEIRSDPHFGYQIILVVLPHEGQQSNIDLVAHFCHKTYKNSLHLSLGDVTRPMFASLKAQDWLAILGELALAFDPITAEMRSGKYWNILELRSIGWATYVSHRAADDLPTFGFPVVARVKDQGLIYLCSREFTGRTTKPMLTTAWKLRGAIEVLKKF